MPRLFLAAAGLLIAANVAHAQLGSVASALITSGDTHLTVGGPLAVTVSQQGVPSGTRQLPVRVTHTESGTFCSRIAAVRLLGLDLQGHDLVFDTYELPRPLCNFGNDDVLRTITPFSDFEYKAACAPGLANVTLMKPVLVQLTPSLGSALTYSVAKSVSNVRADVFRANVTCQGGTSVSVPASVPVTAPTHITAVTTTLDTPHYSGGCPAVLEATATIAGLATGGTASYRWVVSGEQPRTGVVVMNHPNEQVTLPVRATANRTGTVQLVVSSPNSASSAVVPFTVTCTGRVVDP